MKIAACGHVLDHFGTSSLCLRCQRARDLHDSDILASLIPAFVGDPRRGVVPDHCPTCGIFLNAATAADVDVRRPQPDDRTICTNCGELLKYSDDLRLARLTPAEEAETLADLSDRERAVVEGIKHRRAQLAREGNA